MSPFILKSINRFPLIQAATQIKQMLFMLLILLCKSCGHQVQSIKKHPRNHKNDTVKYTDTQLEAFLDSVGQLPTQPLADTVAFGADSVFKHQPQLDTLISMNDFEQLKHAALAGKIDVKTAKRIFKNLALDSTCIDNGIVEIGYHPFGGTTDFDEFALNMGTDHCEGAALYFFKGNKVIARHNGYSHYGLELDHFKDNDGKTVVYYREEFESGSGIWWNNYFFYKYDGDTLIPVLNELQNGNMQGSWGYRTLWLESFVVKTNPLTIKMVYYQQFPDTTQADQGRTILSDSTMVTYRWDQQSKTLQGQYNQSKISKAQILSYYVNDNEFLYINTYYKLLKSTLADKTKRKLTLAYLNKVKNYYIDD